VFFEAASLISSIERISAWAESFDLVQQEDVALMARQFSQGAFKRKPKRGMPRQPREARDAVRHFLAVGRPRLVTSFLRKRATARVIAGVHQECESPGNVSFDDCPRKLAMLRCTFRKVLLYGVFGICRAARMLRARFFMRAPCKE